MAEAEGLSVQSFYQIKLYKIMKKLRFFRYLFLAAGIFSCRQEQIKTVQETQPISSGPLSVEEDRLNFDSKESFQKQIEILQRLTVSELTGWNRNSKIESLFKTQILQSDGNARTNTGDIEDNDLSDVIHDAYFASLINKNGESVLARK